MLGLCCFDQWDPVLYLLMLSEKDEYSTPRAFSICTSATLNMLNVAPQQVFISAIVKINPASLLKKICATTIEFVWLSGVKFS